MIKVMWIKEQVKKNEMEDVSSRSNLDVKKKKD